MSFKHRRSPIQEFTSDELIFLAKEVRKRKKILFGKITLSLTSSDKRTAWKEICTETQRCGWPKRHPDDLRDRWQDLQVRLGEEEVGCWNRNSKRMCERGNKRRVKYFAL